jgi:hypothetical protein
MQIRNKVKIGLAGLAVAGGAAAAAVLIPAGPALGFSSPPLVLQIHVNSASLVARGAGADVSITTRCAGIPEATALVGLTERSGNGIASGVTIAEVKCTDTSRTTTMLVTAGAGGKAFRKGPAIAQGIISGCTPTFCGSQEHQHTIAIK